MRKLKIAFVICSAATMLTLWTWPEQEPFRLPPGAHAYVAPQEGVTFKDIRETITWVLGTLNTALVVASLLKKRRRR